MRARLALTALLLATAAPILAFLAMGLSAELTSSYSLAAALATGFVQGGILAGLAFTALGTFYFRRTLTLVGTAFLLVESIPLLVDGLFVFTLLPAIASLLLLKVEPGDLSVGR